MRIQDFSRRASRAGFALLAAGQVALVAASQAVAGPVELLPGRWAGWGQLMLDGGGVERVKCIATYFAENGGSDLRHNLRCASANYNIDATAQLKVEGGVVSGEWLERTWSTGGAVTGAIKGDGIDVTIVGHQFSAQMTVDTTRCAQSMRIAPQGMGVRRISVRLKKC